MSLKVQKMWMVSCNICKETMRYTDENQVPVICPFCQDGLRVRSEADDLDIARNKRMGKGVGVVQKNFRV